MAETIPAISAIDTARAIETLVARYRAIESELYELSETRRRESYSLIERFKVLFANAPRGVRHMTLEALSAPDVRFALIDTRGPNGGFTNGDRLSITTFRVVREGDASLVKDEQTGAVVGRLSAESLDYKYNAPDDVWCVPRSTSPDMNFSAVLLPLAGELLMRHGVYRAMARFAETALAGQFAEVEAIRAIDRKVDALQAEQKAFADLARARATAGFDLEALDLRHADLVSAMKGHDWTWDYADRPNRASGEHQDKMLAGLAAIPEDEAIALWFRHSYGPMSFFTWERAKKAGAQRLSRRVA